MEEQKHFLLTPHLMAYECGQNKEIVPEMCAFGLGSSYIVPRLEHSYARKNGPVTANIFVVST
jgi:hypothetical protein